MSPLIEAALAEYGEALRSEASRLHRAAFRENSGTERGSFANTELRTLPEASRTLPESPRPPAGSPP